MGCANTKAGATAYGAPEECPEGGDAQAKGEVPKVTVDGDQDGVALNGNAVACVNGDEDTGEEKEACNGDLSKQSEEHSGGDAAAPSAGSDSAAQDGGDSAGIDKEEAKTGEDGSDGKEAEQTSENAESRETQEAGEEKAE